jgi:hypothetical protein
MTGCSDCGTQLGDLNTDGSGGLLCLPCYSKRPGDPPVAELESPGDVPSNGRTPKRQVVLTSASAIRSEAVRWMWRDRVPLRGMTVLAGEKGLGKSICTNAMLPAALTRGTLDGELEGQPVDVLVASAEDDWRSVVKPRLAAHGADLDRVHRVAVEDPNGDGMLTLPDDVARLEEAVTKLRAARCPVGLLVIDPIGAFLTQGTDSHKDAHVRRTLAPVAAMAERLDLAVIVVAHLTKDDSRRLISRVSGSGAFVNAARSVLGFVRNPDDEDGEQGRDRVLVHAASNWGKYAPSLAARVESRLVPVDDGSTADVGYLNVLGETTISVDDIQRGRDDDGESVEEAIIAALAGGSRPSREVKQTVKSETGCGLRTVERAASRMVGRDELTITKGGFPPTSTWSLALAPTPLAPLEETPRGGNVKPPINTGISVAPPSIAATTPCGGGNGDNGHDADLEIERFERMLEELRAND